jgi:hypothetical protein
VSSTLTINLDPRVLQHAEQEAVTGGVKCSHEGRGQKQPPRVGRLVMKEG